jgi:archaellum component FlaC
MLPNTINFRGAIYTVADHKPEERAVPGNRTMKQTVKHYTDPKVKNYPNINNKQVNRGLVEMKQELNSLQHDVSMLKARYDKTFVEYNKFADALEALPTAKTTTDKATWEVRLKSRIDGLDRDLDGIEKSIDTKLSEIAALERQIGNIEVPLTPVATQAPMATQEVPMFKQRPSAVERNTQAIEREQTLISKLQAAKLKPEWADKPDDLYKMDKMIADATKRLQDLRGETVNTDLYGGSGSVG